MTILTYPDKRLKEPSKPVESFDPDLHRLLDAMYETMITAGGIGLAAIQVGEPVRALLINIPNEEEVQDKEELLEIINPEIVSREGEITYSEGCLSVPEFYEEVQRAEKVELRYQDRNGHAMTLHAEGLLAIAVQHEIDHLDGKLFIEKLPMLKRKKFEKEYKKMRKEHKRL